MYIRFQEGIDMRATEEIIRIGIDVGGTNTDAAILKGKDVITTFKTNTTKQKQVEHKTNINSHAILNDVKRICLLRNSTYDKIPQFMFRDYMNIIIKQYNKIIYAKNDATVKKHTIYLQLIHIVLVLKP